MNLAQRLRQEGWNEAWNEAWVEAWNEGYNEGENKGYNKGVKEMALKLFQLGLPQETILKVTALPEDELKKLLDNNADIIPHSANS